MCAVFFLFPLLHWRSVKTLSQTVTNVQNWIWETLVYITLNLATTQTQKPLWKEFTHERRDSKFPRQGFLGGRRDTVKQWGEKRRRSKCTCPLSGFCRFLSLTRCYTGTSLGRFCNLASAAGACPWRPGIDGNRATIRMSSEWPSQLGSEQRETEVVLHVMSQCSLRPWKYGI